MAHRWFKSGGTGKQSREISRRRSSGIIRSRTFAVARFNPACRRNLLKYYAQLPCRAALPLFAFITASGYKPVYAVARLAYLIDCLFGVTTRGQGRHWQNENVHPGSGGPIKQLDGEGNADAGHHHAYCRRNQRQRYCTYSRNRSAGCRLGDQFVRLSVSILVYVIDPDFDRGLSFAWLMLASPSISTITLKKHHPAPPFSGVYRRAMAFDGGLYSASTAGSFH